MKRDYTVGVVSWSWESHVPTVLLQEEFGSHTEAEDRLNQLATEVFGCKRFGDASYMQGVLDEEYDDGYVARAMAIDSDDYAYLREA